MALSEVEREVLRRDLQRLLLLCRELRDSQALNQILKVLTGMVNERESTLQAVETEARRLYALLNAAPHLLPEAPEWVSFHLQALQDVHAITRHFASSMPVHTRHVA